MLWGYVGFGACGLGLFWWSGVVSPRMENQMEKKMNMTWKLGLSRGLQGIYWDCSSLGGFSEPSW